jgi:hypothetical protein
MEERWLKCKVYRGMFSDEMAVKVPQSNGEMLGYFVPKVMVANGAGSEGRLRVRVLRREGITLAILPTEYSDAIAVQESDLIAARINDSRDHS